MRFLIPLVSAALLASPVCLSAQADATPWTLYHAQPLEQQLRLVRTGSAISWPVLGRQISFQQFDRMAVRDEMPVRNLVFSSPLLTLQLPVEAMESWVEAEDKSGKYAFELRHKFDETAIAGISAVRNSSFLRNLDAPSWNAYLGSLGDAPNARLVTNDDSAVNANMIAVLGGRTRVLEYRYSGEEPEDPVRSVLQIFTDLRDGPLVIFTLECETRFMAEIGPNFEVLVDSFDFPPED